MFIHRGYKPYASIHKFIQMTMNRQSSRWQQPEGWDTGIKVYNCITRSKERLLILNKHLVTWYTCGPTVYDSTHIGHASCYVKVDILQRILRDYFHMNLVTVMNVTDIDDKIIRRSEELGVDWQDMARKFETNFWEDLRLLNVRTPDIRIRVTENMSTIVAFIEDILRKDIAYVGKDNSVYFRVQKARNYGKLQKIAIESEGHDVKESNLDFALWKAAKGNEPAWETPWGKGRPGWHIECSALATKILGRRIDFHAGGLDLRFPHHENEEAQSCAFHEANQWVNYWIHTGQLSLAGQQEKMSKSLKNTISVGQLLDNYTSNDFRMACLLSNYRNPMEYSEQMMETAKRHLDRFEAFNTDCQAFLNGKKPEGRVLIDQLFEKFEFVKDEIDGHLKDDFNTAKCVSNLLDLTATVSRMINNPESSQTEGHPSPEEICGVQAVQNYVTQSLEIFGFQGVTDVRSQIGFNDVEGLIEKIVTIRKELRDEAILKKDRQLFEICDKIRNGLKECGVEVKDHKMESSWSFIK